MYCVMGAPEKIIDFWWGQGAKDADVTTVELLERPAVKLAIYQGVL